MAAHWGGLAKDRGGRLDVSAARLALVAIISGFEALLNPMPIRAPAGRPTQTGSEPQRRRVSRNAGAWRG